MFKKQQDARTTKKLTLNRETLKRLHQLSGTQLREAEGGRSGTCGDEPYTVVPHVGEPC